MNYEDVVRAKENTWQSDARKLIENGTEFVVIDVTREQFRDCIALAQEFDYTCFHEDKPIVEDYPDILPSKIGFAKRRPSRPE
jgi:hypothetical protein